ncbi:MAG: DUF6268 family outer membrane beta-barrel protein [Tannerellaceae bacterium]|nr:DUF6268 family outer membrane beta-barrel protein [Tannerellaceae bacterium]
MKYILISVLFLSLYSQPLVAQAYVKMEYFGNSSFRDDNNQKIPGAEGSAMVWQGTVSVPVSVRINEYNRPDAWAIALAGSYTDFRNQGIDRTLCPNEIMNLNLSLMHMRAINEKWSLLFMLGAGIYTPHTDFSQIQIRNVLGNGGGIAIWHLRNNLNLGFGLVINNSFGYPMVFPGAIVEWNIEGKYEVHIQMLSGIELLAGMEVNKYLKVYLQAEMNGAMTLEKIQNKNRMFTHQYVNTGIQSVLQIGKGFTLPVTIGVTPYRAAYYTDRSFKAFFNDDSEYDPHFSASFYVSAAIRYGF